MQGAGFFFIEKKIAVTVLKIALNTPPCSRGQDLPHEDLRAVGRIGTYVKVEEIA